MRGSYTRGHAQLPLLPFFSNMLLISSTLLFVRISPWHLVVLQAILLSSSLFVQLGQLPRTKIALQEEYGKSQSNIKPRFSFS